MSRSARSTDAPRSGRSRGRRSSTPVFGLGFSSAKGVFFDETGLGGAHNAAVNVMIDVGLVELLVGGPR